MSHPYISGPSNIAQMVNQLRKSFPSTVTSETVKKLGLAPNNEAKVINVLQFLGVVDSEGKRTEEAHSTFANVSDDAFAKAFENLVRKAYEGLFELHGDDAWEAGDDKLVTFFRQTDRTGDAIGKRQAAVFKTVAALAGHREAPEQRAKKTTSQGRKAEGKKKTETQKKENSHEPRNQTGSNSRSVGLTVRIEVNLPTGGTKDTYDAIFKSIRENLINE